MKKFVFIFLTGLLLVIVTANNAPPVEARRVSPNVVISQIYGGGGTATASPFRNDFFELFNRGNAPVSLGGWSVQYASTNGSTWLTTPLTDVSLAPGQYYLIQFPAGGANGPNLPTPDVVGTTFISSTTGKVALVNNSTTLSGTCPSGANIVDFVGYGTANCFEGAGGTPTLNVVIAARRGQNGCLDTDQNNTDFTTGVPTPRNTASALAPCGGDGSIPLSGSGAATPNAPGAGASVLLTVRVTPADTPPSTGITVTADLSTIGGAGVQRFFDDGTNGDATANDNTFSFLITAPSETSGGQRAIPVEVLDAQGRRVNVTIALTLAGSLPQDDPLSLGNPSNATMDATQRLNFLLTKPQYSLSYNDDLRTPNWVAWHLTTYWLGEADRQDNYRPDDTLPEGFYRVLGTDYSGSGYDRGHMCPSGDRTRSVPDNSATFLMTNFVPQSSQNNQGPWDRLENYCRDLARAGSELYIVSGGAGSLGRVGNGRVNAPAVTWKVIVVMPNGDNDLGRINKYTRTIAVIVPNQGSVTTDWRQYRTTVQRVESLTGYDFFSSVSRNTQRIIERRIDRQ